MTRWTARGGAVPADQRCGGRGVIKWSQPSGFSRASFARAFPYFPPFSTLWRSRWVALAPVAAHLVRGGGAGHPVAAVPDAHARVALRVEGRGVRGGRMVLDERQPHRLTLLALETEVRGEG